MENIYNNIKLAGGRLTKNRKTIIDILSKSCCLISKEDLIKKLERKNIRPDRSTIYRELLFLVNNQIIKKKFINGIDYFELNKNHHHHLICIKCNRIEKLNMKCHLRKEEKSLAKKNNFKIINHSLDFHGYCQKCQ